MLFNTLKYYVCLNHCHYDAWQSLAIKIFLKTCLCHVNLQQITLLKSYIHPFAHSG